MKKIRLILFAMLAGFVMPHAYSAVVSFYEGENQIKKQGGEWQELELWDKVENGDIIKTNSLGRVHVTFSGNIIKVGPDTEMVIENLSKDEEPVSILVDKGFAWSNVKFLNKSGAFEVKTPTVVAGIRGTKFAVGEMDGEAVLCVCAGEISVQSKDKQYTLKTGEGIDVVNGVLEKQTDHAEAMDDGRALKAFKQLALQKPMYQNCMDCHNKTLKGFEFSR